MQRLGLPYFEKISPLCFYCSSVVLVTCEFFSLREVTYEVIPVKIAAVVFRCKIVHPFHNS
jgi:hypothetical protein